MSETLNLHQRMLAIIEEVGAVAKTGALAVARNVDKKTFAIDHVVDALREPCREHGVMLWSTLEESSFQVIEDKDYKGNPRNLFINTAKVRLHFVNVDDPEDTFNVLAEGDGYDYSDKAPGKAFSYALKTALLANFQMRGQPHSEADDIEPKATAGRQPATSEPQATSKQLDELKKLAEDNRSTKKVDGVTLKSYIVPLLKDGCTESEAAKMIVWAKEELGDAKPASPANVNRLKALMNNPAAQKVMVKDLPIAKHLARLLEEEPSDEKAELAIKWAQKELEDAKKGEAA